MRYLFLSSFVVVIAFISQSLPAISQTVHQRQEGIEAILTATEQLCGKFQNSGSVSELELEGEADAGIEVLSKKLLDIGFDGAARLNEGEYSGVLRDQLGDELKDIRQCNQKIFDALFAVVFAATPETALSKAELSIVEGRVRPQSYDVIALNARFSMKLGEKISLGNKDLILWAKKHNSAKVILDWVNLQTGERKGSTVGVFASIDVMNCKVILYEFDYGNEALSLKSVCP